MSTDKPGGQALETVTAVAWLLGLLASFGAVAAAPFVVAHLWGEGWGVLAGVTLGVAWMRFMPTTCRNGGLIWSVFGIWQVLLIGMWIVRGVVLGASLVF